MNHELRTCRVCGCTGTLDAFPPVRGEDRVTIYHSHTCYECRRARQRAWDHANPDKRREYRRRDLEKHYEARRTSWRKRSIRYRFKPRPCVRQEDYKYMVVLKAFRNNPALAECRTVDLARRFAVSRTRVDLARLLFAGKYPEKSK